MKFLLRLLYKWFPFPVPHLVFQSCQADLVKDNGHKYFLSVLADPYMPVRFKYQPFPFVYILFVLFWSLCIFYELPVSQLYFIDGEGIWDLVLASIMFCWVIACGHKERVLSFSHKGEIDWQYIQGRQKKVSKVLSAAKTTEPYGTCFIWYKLSQSGTNESLY